MSHHTEEYQDPFAEWLKVVKLRGNPFQDYSARKDSDLSSIFVPLADLPLNDLMKDSQTWVIFGEKGSGKTLLRMMVAARCRPINPVSDVLALECNWQTLDKMLRKAGSLETLSLNHWVETLIELTVPHLPEDQRSRWVSMLLSTRSGRVFLAYAHEDRSYVDELAESLEKAGVGTWYDRKLHKGRRWCKELEEQIQSARAMVAVLSRQSRDSAWMEREALFAIEHGVPVIPLLIERVDLPLWAVGAQCARNTEELIRTLRATGRLHYTLESAPWYEFLGELVSAAQVDLIVCLVDEVDEALGLQEQSDVLQLLSCIMAPQLRAIPGFAFRYFLPLSLADALRQQGKLRLDKCRVGYLRWTPEDLKRLLCQRMIAFSESRAAPHTSLGALCDPADGFAGRIDDDLAILAEGSPRAAVCLADHLLRFHCREIGPPLLIRSATWEVVWEWWQENQEQILGLSAALPFRTSGKRIFFQNQEVVLNKRYHALLRCLICARGDVCSPEDLARAGWPGEDPKGVTPDAVDEAVRRMKKKLGEQGIDPQWIERVRGRGYRIHPFL
ncbi:MAG: TIR domain-containing protein [Anaerolineae bacterium]